MDSPIYTNSANSLSSASLANLMFKLPIIKISLRAWRDGLAVKRVYCSSVGSALPKDLHLVPSTHVRQLTPTYSSSFRDSNVLFWPPSAHTHMAYIHTWAHTYIEIIF